jgi:hypothetical protein
MSSTPGQASSGPALRVGVFADGTAEFQARMAGVANSIGRTNQQSGIMTGGWGRQEAAVRGLSSRMGGLKQGFGELGMGLAQIAGMLGVGIGVGAIAASINSLRNFDASLTAIGYSAGLSTQQTASLGQQITDMTTQTGRSREELLGAVTAAQQLGIGLGTVLGNMKGASDFARLLGVNLTTLMPALAAVNKVGGPGVSAETQMGLYGIGQRHSGMTSDDFAAMVTKLAPRAARMGLSGQAGLQSLFTMTSAAARYMNPREIPGGMEGFMTFFEDSKNQKKLAGKGVDTTNVSTAFRDIIGAVHHDAKALVSLNLPDAIKDFVRASAQGMDEMTRAGNELQSFDVGDFKQQLETAGASEAASWDKIKVAAAEMFVPISGNILEWLSKPENTKAIVSTFQSLGVALAEALGAVVGFWTTTIKIGAALGGWIESVVHGNQAFRNAQAVVGAPKEGENFDEYHGRIQAEMARQSTQNTAATNEATAYHAEHGWFKGDLAAGAIERTNYGAAHAPQAALAAQSLGRALNNIVNVFLRTDGETVHAEADAQNDGRRVPVTARGSVEPGRQPRRRR